MLRKTKDESGYALVSVLIIFGLSMLMVNGLLRSTSNNIRLQSVINTNNNRYYSVEDSLGQATAWIQTNSKYLVTLFQDSNFENNFDFSDPTIGNNDSDVIHHFNLATQVKINSSNNSAIISNNDAFGVSSFPTGVHYDDNSDTKNLVAEFNSLFPNAENGGVNLRITVLSSIPSATGYSPVLRVDAITGSNPDRGTHLYSYVYGEFINTTTGSTSADNSGFYGHNEVSLGGASWCKSAPWTWTGAAWSRGAYGANCLMQSQGEIDLSGSGTKIHGAAKTNLSSGVTDPAKVTDNNIYGCAGFSCHTTNLEVFDNFATACPLPATSYPSITISANRNFLATEGVCTGTKCCFNQVTVNNKIKASLVTPNTIASYHIKSLVYGGGHKDTQVNVNPPAHTDVVDLYVQQVGSDHINGQRVANGTKAPQQLRFIYTGTNQLTLNGTAEMRAHLFSPYTSIKINGNFAFYGKINATALDIIGTADLYSDEVNSLTAVPITTADLNLRVTKITQRYR